MTFEEAMRFTRGFSSNAAFEDPECRAYFDILMSLPRNSTIVEIGLQYGRSSSIALQVAKLRRIHYVGIDPFDDHPEVQKAWLDMARKTGHSKMVWIPAHSRDVVVDYDIRAILIDGDHTDHVVQEDCERYLPHVLKGGYAMLHDYGSDSLPDVYRVANAYFAAHPEWKQLPTVGCLGIWRRDDKRR